MIDYLRDIKPLEGDLSDDEIANHLSTRTYAPISADGARDILLESGAVVIDPSSGNRIGPLIAHYQSMSDGQDKVLLAWFLNHVFGSGKTVETNSFPRSKQFAAVEANLPADIASVASKIVADAGGRPDAATVLADVTTARELYLLEQQTKDQVRSREKEYSRLYNQNIAPLLDSNNTDSQAWKSAINNMASEWGN